MTYATVAPTVPLPITNDELTYELTADQLLQVGVGQLVFVPVRGRRVRGVVTALTRRKPTGVTRLVPIERVLPVRVPWPLIKLAQQLRESSGQPLGVCFDAMLPPVLRRMSGQPAATNLEPPPSPKSTARMIELCEAPQDRWQQYEKLIERALAAGRSALIVFSNAVELQAFCATNRQPVELWLSDGGAQARWRQWQSLSEPNHPRCIAGLRSAIFAPLPNLGVIVVDDPFGRGQKSDQAPYVTSSSVAGLRHKNEHCHLLLGDSLPPISSAERTPVRYRPLTALAADSAKPTLIAYAAEQWLAEAAELGSVFVLIQRVGAGIRRCQQCGTAVSCPRCRHIPTEQHGQLQCGECGWHGQAPARCTVCHGTTIILRGVGTEAVAEHVRAITNRPVAILDRNHPTLPVNRPSIIVGTAFALPHLSATSPDRSLVLGIDLAKQRASYDAVERALRQLAALDLLTTHETAFETSQLAEEWFQQLARGDFRSLLMEDRAQRIRDGYPPATRLLLARSDTEAQLDPLASALRDALGARSVVGPYLRRSDNRAQLLIKLRLTTDLIRLLAPLVKHHLLRDVALEPDPLTEAIE